MQTGFIGYLRADMDSNGEGFFSTWNDFRKDLKTQAFKDEFDEVIAEQSGNERRTELLLSQHKDAPVESVPVGRIEYLGLDGRVSDVMEYIDEAEFIRDIMEENHYGMMRWIGLMNNIRACADEIVLNDIVYS